MKIYQDKKTRIILSSFSYIIVITLLATSTIFQSCSKEIETNFEEGNSSESFIETIKTIYPEIKLLQERRIDLQKVNEGDHLKSSEINLTLQYIENETERIMSPLLEKSYNLLIEYGFTHDKLIEEVSDANSPDVIYMAIVVVGHMSKNHFDPPRLKLANVEEDGGYDWYDYLLRSVGIDAVIEIVNSQTIGSKAAKKLINKAVRKVASIALG